MFGIFAGIFAGIVASSAFAVSFAEVLPIFSHLVNLPLEKFQMAIGLLLQLPAAQLENALNKNPTLKSSLVAYADQSGIRSSLPRPTLVVLGLIQEAPVQGEVAQSQAAQSEAVEPTVSAEATVETTTQEATSPS